MASSHFISINLLNEIMGFCSANTRRRADAVLNGCKLVIQKCSYLKRGCFTVEIRHSQVFATIKKELIEYVCKGSKEYQTLLAEGGNTKVLGEIELYKYLERFKGKEYRLDYNPRAVTPVNTDEIRKNEEELLTLQKEVAELRNTIATTEEENAGFVLSSAPVDEPLSATPTPASAPAPAETPAPAEEEAIDEEALALGRSSSPEQLQESYAFKQEESKGKARRGSNKN